jgi:hypothetical protein
LYAPIGMIAKSMGPEARNSANESLSAVLPEKMMRRLFLSKT